MRTLATILLLLSGPALSAPDGPPEISRGVRVLMGDSAVLEKKKEAWAFFVPQQREVLDIKETKASMGGTALSTAEEVISFFSSLPATTQNNGLWITYLGRDPTTKAEQEKFAKLTTGAKEKGLMLFVCMPAQSTTPGTSFVAWKCENVSSRRDIASVICQPKKDLSPSRAPQWSCAWLQ